MPTKAKTNYPEIKEIKHDLDSLKHDAIELAQHVKKDGMDQVNETSHTLRAYGTVKLKQAENGIRKNPLQSVAIAFAGGLVASFLLGRR